MNNNILNTGVQHFIVDNLNTDIMSVLLKKPIFEGVSQKELAQQIESKKKCQNKLPTWFEKPQIYYPKKINIEQTSSEITAKYKSKLVSGKTLVDLTGGLGIDSYYFSKKIDTVFHCEIDQKLHEIVAHNFPVLNTKNIQTFAQDGLVFLEKSTEDFDWLYLDPSRRNKTKGKVFKLSDCEPNITEHLEFLLRKSANILLKTSPLLDISIGCSSLKNVKEVHVVAINNEAKELLWIIERGFVEEIKVRTINFTKSKSQVFDFFLTEEKKISSEYSAPLSYIYEPNSAILKSGAFKSIGVKYNLKKIHVNTHLYTSNELVDFPGRRFKVSNLLHYKAKDFKKLKIDKANVSAKNFPLSVAAIRKKLKIKEGGDDFLLFFKDYSDKYYMARCYKQ